MPYTAMQSLLDALWTRGAHNYMRSAYVNELDDAAIAALVGQHQAVPSPHSEIHVQHFGGAVAHADEDDAAFGDRSARYVLNVIARSPDAEGFDANVAWARDTTEALAPGSRDGAYVNFMGDARDERLRASYGEARVRAAGRAQAPLRPHQPLPTQPEHHSVARTGDARESARSSIQSNNAREFSPATNRRAQHDARHPPAADPACRQTIHSTEGPPQ